VHGVRGGSLLAAGDHHRRLRPVEVPGGAERASVREPEEEAVSGKLWTPRRHAAEALGIDRRAFIAAGLAGGAGGLLGRAGGNSRGPKSARGLLRAAERWNERVERGLFRHTAMNAAPAGVPAAGAAFPSYFISGAVPVWDEAARGVWRL